MFGGSYTSSALGIMRELVDWAQTENLEAENDGGVEDVGPDEQA